MKKMKKLIIVNLMLMLPILCFGEESRKEAEKPAPPLQHEKKVHVDEKRESIYWPMSMPFWVRLTNSPAENAPSFLLQKVHLNSQQDSKKYAQQGITLEIQGRQFIRWYNKITAETTFLKFYADGTPPTTKITPVHSPSSGTGERIFYGKGLKLSVSAEDEISGVEAVYISFNGAPFEPYGDTISLDQEKTYHIRAYAVDHVGYAGTPVSIGFPVDLTAPGTSHEVQGDFSGSVLAGGSTIRLTAADMLSGLKNTYYGFDSQPEPSLYKGKDIPLDGLKDGEHQLYYYSLDRVLNRENRRVYTFYLDRTPPRAEGRFQGVHHQAGEKHFVSPRTKIVLSAEDNKIGEEKIEYSFGGDKYKTYTGPFPLDLEPGEHMIRCRAMDKFGNMNTPAAMSFQVDGTPPITTREIKGAHFTQRNDTWITKDTVVHLAAGDDASGLSGIYYQLGEDVEPGYRRYDAPISISAEGRYLFKFHSMDNVGNRETDQTGILVVDNTPPQLVTTFSLVSKRGVTLDDGVTLAVYPRYTSLFLGAADNSSGIASILYRINKATEEVYTRAIRFQDEGTFSIKIRIEDNVGNVTNETIRFVIQD
jgi:hypothetical protein